MLTACPACGAGVAADQRFCLQCGTPLAAACPTCGATRVPGARFCGQCGMRLDEGAPSAAGGPSVTGPPPPVRGPAPSPSQAPTERRLVSVLFADLVGFTTRSESRDPEEVREFLGRWFERAAEVIARYGGTVEKFIGDAVMAVWGTPTTHEDDAERAVRAALDLVDAVRGLAPPGAVDGPSVEPAGASPGAAPGAPEPPVELRAAVMTGEAAVTVGAIGQGLVAGDLVNTTSRLQSAAAPGIVLVDETTMSAAGRAVAFEPAGEQHLRGKALPVTAWRALRVVAERGGVGRREGLEPPFVGRDEELRLLKESLHAAGREGKSRLVTIVGQAGLGKSRLAWELLKYTDGLLETVFWHEGRSPSYGEGVAYWALGEMVRQRCRIMESESTAVARPKLTTALSEWLPDAAERRWIEPRIAALLGLVEAPAGDRDELFAAWRTFFERISEQGTAVLVFEDLHWADESLLDFIEHLLEWARARPILVVGLSRPELLERRPTWGSGLRASTTIHLEPLPRSAMADLLRGLAPGLPTAAVEQIAGRAEGVPLYAVETVRMLLDEARLVREGERYRLVDENAPVAVPASLQALIAARLDALEPDDRSLIQDAAVLGKTFTLPALAAISGIDPADLEARLRGLVRKELLGVESSQFSPERGQYGFVQGLLREVAYGTLARRERRQRHLAAARYFEALGDDELAGLLARHYLDAFRAAPEGAEGRAAAAQARLALRAAAERSIALHANAAAVNFIEECLIVTDDPAERAALWVMAAEPAWASGGLERGERYLRQAIEWFTAAGREAEVSDAIATLAIGLLADSRMEEAREILVPAVARLDDASATETAPRLLNQLARTHLFSGEPERASGPLDRGLTIAERLGLEPEIAELFVTKAWTVDELGRRREARLLAHGGLELAQRHGRLHTELRARMNLSNLLTTADPRRSYRLASDGVDLALRVGNLDWAASLAGNSGYAALLCGQWDDPVRRVAELQRPYLTEFARVNLMAPALLVLSFRDRSPEADASLDLDQLLESASPQNRSMAFVVRAMVAYARGVLETVEADARAAFAEAPGTGEAEAALIIGAHALVELRAPERLRDLLATLEPRAWTGDWFRAGVVESQSGLAALEGRFAEAEAGFRRAVEIYRVLDVPPGLAIAEIHMLALLGDQLPDREALANEARAILTHLDARTLLARLDASVLGATRAAAER